MDWVGAVANALSLAVGVATGSLITFYLTKKEFRKLFEGSELVRLLREVLVLSRDVLKSSEARTFFKRLSEVLDAFLKSEGTVEELIKIPKD